MDFIGKSSAWIKPFVLYCLLSHSCKASTLVQPLLYGCCVYYIVAVFAKKDIYVVCFQQTWMHHTYDENMIRPQRISWINLGICVNRISQILMVKTRI